MFSTHEILEAKKGTTRDVFRAKRAVLNCLERRRRRSPHRLGLRCSLRPRLRRDRSASGLPARTLEASIDSGVVSTGVSVSSSRLATQARRPDGGRADDVHQGVWFDASLTLCDARPLWDEARMGQDRAGDRATAHTQEIAVRRCTCPPKLEAGMKRVEAGRPLAGPRARPGQRPADDVELALPFSLSVAGQGQDVSLPHRNLPVVEARDGVFETMGIARTAYWRTQKNSCRGEFTAEYAERKRTDGRVHRACGSIHDSAKWHELGPIRA